MTPNERWRARNDYNEHDAWECEIRLLSALLGSKSLFMPGADTSAGWLCFKCDAAMAVSWPGSGENEREYHYWCRCGNHGSANSDTYHTDWKRLRDNHQKQGK